MRILAVDVGTGTQDILLFDTELQPENCFKLVMPSPTMMVARHVQEATRAGHTLVLTGVTMGGGPSHWAVRDHAAAGHKVYATPAAAQTFDDDLARVAEMGIHIIDEAEVSTLARRSDSVAIELADYNHAVLVNVFAEFGLPLDLDGLAVAVFDHGAAPSDTSDRQFRFDYLDRRIREANRLSAFAYRSYEIPTIMTRLKAVTHSAFSTGLPASTPMMVMDTAPAAVLGATQDPRVGTQRQVLVANVGNFHTLAFRLGEGGIEGVFEHHTGLVDTAKLDHLIASLAATTLRHEDVFDDHGHGALMYCQEPIPVDFLAVTGPRRSVMRESRHPAYFAAPYGDMMIAGCYGLIRAWADVYQEDKEVIRESLNGVERGAPWDHE